MSESAEKKIKTDDAAAAAAATTTAETKKEEAQRVIAVTGSNKGIGEAIVRALLAQGHTVIATARDPKLGAAAMEKWKDLKGTVKFFKCDISKKADVQALRTYIESDFEGRLDTLINNAGFAFKGDIFGADEAEQTIAINYTGTKFMCQEFLPILAQSPLGGRCVNVCSQAGNLTRFSKTCQEWFTKPDLTVAELDELMVRFPTDIRSGDYKEKGWPESMYGTSKLAEIALTKVLAKSNPKVQVIACCPGYVNTDMSSGMGPLTVEEGADTPVWLATNPGVVDASGLFFYKRAPITW